MNHRVCFSLVALVAVVVGPLHAEEPDLNTPLMLATFKLTTPESSGTAFVLRRHDQEGEGEGAKSPRFVVVTAEHVLRQLKGDETTLVGRRREADGGYTKSNIRLKVRDGGKALWTRHPTADVAVLGFSPPPEFSLPEIAVAVLASDADLGKYEIHPGDLIRCLGYPHPNQFEANGAGFGVVRIGCVASYPLLPTAKTKTFLCDLNTFEGDSGSPVYLSEDHRSYGGKAPDGRVRLILGLVAGQHFIDEEFKMIYQAGKFRHRMGMTIVIHAASIRETIALLPDDPE